jgi:hypothetical protein
LSLKIKKEIKTEKRLKKLKLSSAVFCFSFFTGNVTSESFAKVVPLVTKIWHQLEI